MLTGVCDPDDATRHHQRTLAKEFHPDKFRVAFPQCKEAYSSGTEPEADFKESIADKAFMHISELYQLSQK